MRTPEAKARQTGRLIRSRAAIGEFWSYPQSRTFAELLTDCEEDRTLRAVLVGMLREAGASSPGLIGESLEGSQSRAGSLERGTTPARAEGWRQPPPFGPARAV